MRSAKSAIAGAKLDRQSTRFCVANRNFRSSYFTHASFNPLKHGSAEHVNRAHNENDSKRAGGACAITFQTPSGVQVVKAPKGANIYDTADYAGLRLPASCKQGSCSSCVGKVLAGKIVHTRDPQCLTAKLKAEGYVALCSAAISGDATILTHQGAKLRAERSLQMDRMRHPH